VSGYLLDTHVFLWWFDDPAKLSEKACRAIRDTDNRVYVSAAAVWEMGIKKSLGRLDIPANLPDVLRGDNIEVLDVNIRHALSVADLPMLHQDPFDRMQIVQANLEGLTILTRDTKIQQYDVLWIGA
jgi:PIN domain nuclease of toxin-antitoxin system